MATALTFKKIEGITEGSAFTVNAFANDKTVEAIVYFNNPARYGAFTKFTPKINSVKVGGQNWLSTEIIKITYEMGYVETNGAFRSFVDAGYCSSASHQVSEKSGTVSSSVDINVTRELTYQIAENTFIAYKIKIESTQNLVGCKVVMSGFELYVEHTPIYLISLKRSPENGGTVSGGTYYYANSNATITAKPATGYKFVKWNDENTNASRTITVTGDVTYTAYFELDKINKIYVDTSQPTGIYVDETNKKIVFVVNGTVSTPNSSAFDMWDGYHIVVQNTIPSGMEEIREVYVDTTKVYG